MVIFKTLIENKNLAVINADYYQPSSTRDVTINGKKYHAVEIQHEVKANRINITVAVLPAQ